MVSTLLPEPWRTRLSDSGLPRASRRDVRGLKERHRNVRAQRRIRERSTIPRATGGESGSSLTFKKFVVEKKGRKRLIFFKTKNAYAKGGVEKKEREQVLKFV